MLVCLFAGSAQASFVTNWIPFELARGHISIPVTLNGKPSTAIFDTGASGNGIAKAFLIQNPDSYRKGRQIVVQGVYGRERVHLADRINVVMFGVNFTIDELMPMSLGQHGFMIGLPFFEEFVVQIDYGNERMRLASRDVIDLRKLANVKMKRASGSAHPMVRVRFNDESSMWMTLDTGNTGGFVMKRFDATKHDWLERFGTTEILAKGATGQRRSMDEFRLPSIEVGPFTVENVRVMVPAEGVKTNIAKDDASNWRRTVGNRQSSGLLGYDLLRHFVVTIDFKRNLLHLEPAPEITSQR